MTPISYQGPRADAEQPESHSQDASLAFEKAQSETQVAKLLAEHGSEIYTITETMSLASAVAELAAKKVGILPVIDLQGTLVGVLSERDIMRAVAKSGGEAMAANVDEYMTRDPKTCSAEDKIVDVMKTMSDGRFRHMPVMQGGVVAGMISIRDIVQNRVQELELEALKIKQLMVG